MTNDQDPNEFEEENDDFIDEHGYVDNDFEEEDEEQLEGDRNFDAVAEQQEQARKWKLKDGDREEEVDETELLKRAQKASAADRRFQEAAQQRKQADEQLNQLKQALLFGKQNPASLLQQLGIDPRQFSEGYLSKHIEESRLTPEQRAQRQEREELEQYRKQIEEAKTTQQQAQDEEIRLRNVQDIQTGLMEALSKFGVINDPNMNDPELSLTLSMDTAKYLLADRRKAYAEGREPTVTYEDAVRRAMGQYQRTIQHLVKTLDPDKLYEFLGEDGKKKFRQADLKRHKTAPTARPSAGTTPRVNTPVDKAPLSEKEWRDQILKRTRR